MDKPLVPSEILEIYEEYQKDTINLDITRKPMDGLLGFGVGPGSDACHDRFSQRLEKALDDFTATNPSSEETSAVMMFMFGAPTEYRTRLGYWMLEAAQGMADKLINLLSEDEAGKLTQWYSDNYPKSGRLPVQDKVFAHLKQQAGKDFVLKRKSLMKRLFD